MGLNPFANYKSPVAAMLDGLKDDEKRTKAELDELKAKLPKAIEAHLAATANRRSLREKADAMETKIEDLRVALANAAPAASQAIALDIVTLEAQRMAIIGTPPGRPYREGAIDALLVDENRALSARQELERRCAGLERRLDGIKKLRESDLGQDAAIAQNWDPNAKPVKIERIPAPNLTADDAKGGF